jgi:hypothetical protein
MTVASRSVRVVNVRKAARKMITYIANPVRPAFGPMLAGGWA